MPYKDPVKRREKAREYTKAWMRKWRAEHPEEHRARSREWRKANPEKAKAIDRTQRSKRREKNKVTSKQWRIDHPERQRALATKWRKANPSKCNASARKWRATPNGRRYVFRRNLMKRDAGPVPTSEMLSERELRVGSACAYCARGDGPFEWDHILALSRGGTNAILNLTISCRTCNRSKDNRPWFEWFREQPFYRRHRAVKIIRSMR